VAATALPALRPDLVVRPVGDDGQCVVKDPGTGAYFQLGPQEYFLLTLLDGRRDAGAARDAFEGRFGQPLSADELDEFVAGVREQGLLDRPAGPDPRGPSLLFWRVRAFDPDRLFTRLEPWLRFAWTRGFLAVTAGGVALAALAAWANRDRLAGSFHDALRWETAVWAWLALAAVTLVHEFAHGLTCKHFGGEVREVGFLCVLFVPCFYCDVSDAWLFREKSKRLWVTFAGGYFELVLWAAAVFAWRLTVPGTFPNYLAFVVATACGVQTLFNFNPLLKLDGYYLLSDWLGLPNLKQRADDRAKGHLRRLLWGAPRPEGDPRGRLLTAYGLASLLFSLGFLAASLGVLGRLARAELGWVGLAGVGVLGVLGLGGLLTGLAGGEVMRMVLTRHRRTAAWLTALGAAAAAVVAVEVPDRSGGPFRLRSATRAEVRAPAAGFVRDVGCDEGDRVSVGAPLVRIEVPDLRGRLAQKRADVAQAEARLDLMREEHAEARRRAGRAAQWRDRAAADLERAGRVLVADLDRLDKLIAQAEAEADAAAASLDRTQSLVARGAGSAEEAQEAERRVRATRARLAQAHAERRAREAKGETEARLELDRRGHELTEARAALAVLDGGARARAVEAERTRLAGLRAEEADLLAVQARLAVCAPVAGVVTTPRLRETAGQYVREGDLLCVIEEPDELEAEVTLAEQDAGPVRPGQPIGLKARAFPHEWFTARVARVAPAAAAGEGQAAVTAYCRLPAGGGLRPGMTGYARVYRDDRSVAGYLFDRAVRSLRTEFWW
jgi:putative peptide zinc metalloprotease protein